MVSTVRWKTTHADQLGAGIELREWSADRFSKKEIEMPRVRKSELLQVEHLAAGFAATPQPLNEAAAIALAGLCVRWEVAPAAAMQRALELAAIVSGAIPGREVPRRK